jgi:hypothetical protein
MTIYIFTANYLKGTTLFFVTNVDSFVEAKQ